VREAFALSRRPYGPLAEFLRDLMDREVIFYSEGCRRSDHPARENAENVKKILVSGAGVLQYHKSFLSLGFRSAGFGFPVLINRCFHERSFKDTDMAGKKILVVDDMRSIIDLITVRLTSEGFEVCTAQNGAEAIEKAKSEKPLAIVMDVMMPGMSGFEAIKKLRDLPETRSIPAIIISAKVGMKEFFADVSGVEFMPKPVDMDLLVKRLTVLVGGVQPLTDQPKCVVLAGVEDLLVARIRTLLRTLNFEVFTAINETNAVLLIKNMNPAMVLCQFWEDEHIFSPREIVEKLSANAAVAKPPFYVYCKPGLSVEAMRSFDPDKIVTYKETSDLLRSVENLVKK